MNTPKTLIAMLVLSSALAACDSSSSSPTVSDDGSQGGTTAGAGTAGGDTAGAGTAGGDTAGAGTAGGDTAGAGTAGGDTAGAGTAGGDTAGAGTAGGDTAGAGTAGGDTAGADTAGGDTAGAGTVGDDNAGAGTAGGDTAGAGTAGGDTAGAGTAGGDTAGADTAGGDTAGADTAGGDTAGAGTAGGDTAGAGTAGGDTAGADTAGGDTAGAGTAGGDTAGAGTAGGDTAGGDTAGADPEGNAGGEDSEPTFVAEGQPRVSTNAPYPLVAVERPATPGLGLPQPPTLDPAAATIPAPNRADPFGFGLEFDGEATVPGGPPTQPKNLRAELVSNNWAEINWAPSNDDGEVVQYTIRRDDGVEYIVRGDQFVANGGAQAEIDKYWSTTSFLDCNFTRFDQEVHACGTGNQPIPGTTYIYTVTAVDNAGQESAASEPLSITYLLDQNAPVPRYNDLDRDSNTDDFVETTDLSAVDYFLDERFQLVFQDEFNEDSLDLEKWQTQLTFGPETIINDEKQLFVNTQDPDLAINYDPFTFTGSSLIIEAIPTPDNERANLPAVCDTVGVPEVEQCDFLSGALSSFDRYGFLYGYTEGRFKVSGAAGALSSFFLFHRFQGTGNSFHAPEIDILEYLGENPFGDEFAFQTYHYESPNTPSGTIVRSAPTMFDPNEPSGLYADGEFHTFGVLWEPQLVIWYIDGVEVIRMFGPQVSRRPMNIVNYLVTGSSWAPTPDVTNEALFPIQFEADYIRVYQRDQFVGSSSYGITQ